MSMRDFVTLACGTELRNGVGEGGCSRSIFKLSQYLWPFGFLV